MGAWGVQPWDNDTAADWFGATMDGNPLVDRVDEALSSGSSEQQYAALWIVAKLGRAYIWPIARLDATLKLAKASVDAMLHGNDPDDLVEEFEGDVDLVSTLTALRDEIEERIPQ